MFKYDHLVIPSDVIYKLNKKHSVQITVKQQEYLMAVVIKGVERNIVKMFAARQDLLEVLKQKGSEESQKKKEAKAPRSMKHKLYNSMVDLRQNSSHSRKDVQTAKPPAAAPRKMNLAWNAVVKSKVDPTPITAPREDTLRTFVRSVKSSSSSDGSLSFNGSLAPGDERHEYLKSLQPCELCGGWNEEKFQLPEFFVDTFRYEHNQETMSTFH